MNDATGQALEVELHRALEKVVAAIADVIPDASDVIDPGVLVRRWLGQLEPTHRARVLMLVLSEGWEDHVAAIARAVLAGETTRCLAAVVAAEPEPGGV